MKKYYLEGINEDNQRKLFETARKIGICKLYTSYGSGSKGKLKSTGLISFIRNDDISEKDLKTLTEELSAIGIKISKYIHDKGMKVSLNLVNVLKGEDYAEKDENTLIELG